MTRDVISFAEEPARTTKRCLVDLPDRVVVGTWTSTPGKWKAFTNRDEFCTILSGHCRLISEQGTIKEFRSGDAFLIPNGFQGYWEVIETTTKHFVIRNHPPHTE